MTAMYISKNFISHRLILCRDRLVILFVFVLFSEILAYRHFCMYRIANSYVYSTHFKDNFLT